MTIIDIIHIRVAEIRCPVALIAKKVVYCLKIILKSYKISE